MGILLQEDSNHMVPGSISTRGGGGDNKIGVESLQEGGLNIMSLQLGRHRGTCVG